MEQGDVNCLDGYKTDLHACSLEVVETKDKCYSSIGCYELEEEQKQRNGQILLFSVPAKEAEARFNDPVQSISTDSGILDGKWLTVEKRRFGLSPDQFGGDDGDDDSLYFYATANASGLVQVYQLTAHDHHGRARLQLLGSSSSADCNGGICLALDWDRYSFLRSSSSSSSSVFRLACSYSDGSMRVFQVDLSAALSPASSCEGAELLPLELECLQTYEMAHSYRFQPSTQLPAEVWTVAFAQHEEHLLWSGGDDATCQIWDVRVGSSPVGKVQDDNGSFKWSAGVTTMAQHPANPNWMAVGSYDEHVRFYDARFVSRPYQTTHVGGGVWRLKWQPSSSHDTSLLLVAAMHGGCRLLSHTTQTHTQTNTQSSHPEVNVIQEFHLHKSMAYGVDWISNNRTVHGTHIVASCSFYDNQAYLWKTLPI